MFQAPAYAIIEHGVDLWMQIWNKSSWLERILFQENFSPPWKNVLDIIKKYWT